MERSRDRLTGKFQDAFTIIKNIAHAVNPYISDELIRQAADHRRIRFIESLAKMPDVSVGTVKRLKDAGKKTALLSNADVIETEGWSKCPVVPFFDVVIFSCEAGFMKPDREIYGICLEKLGEDPGSCVFVGDGGSDEFIGAKSWGITTVMVTGIAKRIWPDKLSKIEVNADYIIDDVSELLP
jgi:putative hydrolase of the HAD superfamily